MKQRKLSYSDLSQFCRGLGATLHAGVSLGDGLLLLAEDEPSGWVRDMLNEAGQRADSGLPLSAVLRQAGHFPHYMSGLVEIGERTGKLEEALEALARYYEQRDQMDWRIRSALTYPAILLLLMLVVIVVLLTKVLPVFDEVYAALGGRLTGVAGGLLKLGQWLGAAMPVLLVLLAAVVIFIIAFMLSSGLREKLLSLWRRKRGSRGLSRKQADARFAQALSMGMSSGLPLNEALELAASLLEDTPEARGRCLDCARRLEQGEDFGAALRDSGVLPARFSRLLSVALRSGNGDVAMAEIACSLSEEADRALEDRVSRVEPALVLAAALLVGVILLAVMLPLMNIMSVIG